MTPAQSQDPSRSSTDAVDGNGPSVVRAPTLLEALLPRDSGVARTTAMVAAVVLGTALVTLSAKVNVPVWPVPVTLQTFAVAALAATFGARLAVATVMAYLLQGAAGLPVFATGGGIGYLVGPTGGFLAGTLLMAYIIGRAADAGATRKPLLLLAAMIAGDAALFVAGFGWLLAFGSSAAWLDQSNLVGSAFAGAVQPFIVWDLLKMGLAALTASGLLSLAQLWVRRS